MADQVDLQACLAAAVDAAKAAGEVIRAAFHQPKAVEHKGAVDLVTDTDKQAELLIVGRLQAAFPGHQIIGEEGSAAQGYASSLTDQPTWMVDPLDGTTNFIHCFPFVCTSIALVVARTPVVAVVYNPVLGELFTATRGGGAQLNGSPITSSGQQELGRALVSTEVGTIRDQETIEAVFGRMQALGSKSRSLRCLGSCALNMCSVACGRLDAFYEVGFGGCWDAAAGALVVEEAGGRVLDPQGGPFDLMARRVLATNGHLAPQVVEVLAACKYSAQEPQQQQPAQ